MSIDLFQLDDAVCIVTGGSGWLGTAMVEALAEAGATVVAVARDQARLDAAVAPLAARGLRVEGRACDVTSSDWPQLVHRVGRDHGRLDVLVNNAHIGRGGSMRTSSPEDFEEAFGLAVTSAWQGIEAARPRLAERAVAGGSPCVVNVASMYALVAPDLRVYDVEEGRNPPYYGAAKAALLQLTRYAAAELGPEGIRVNSLTPGPFPAAAAQENARFVDQLAERTMLGRVGAPQDIKTALLFLASPQTRFVTAANIVVDGGWTAR